MAIFQLASAPLLMGSPESVSSGLLIILVAVLVITLLSVLSAVFDMML